MIVIDREKSSIPLPEFERPHRAGREDCAGATQPSSGREEYQVCSSAGIDSSPLPTLTSISPRGGAGSINCAERELGFDPAVNATAAGYGGAACFVHFCLDKIERRKTDFPSTFGPLTRSSYTGCSSHASGNRDGGSAADLLYNDPYQIAFFSARKSFLSATRRAGQARVRLLVWRARCVFTSCGRLAPSHAEKWLALAKVQRLDLSASKSAVNNGDHGTPQIPA